MHICCSPLKSHGEKVVPPLGVRTDVLRLGALI